MRLIRPAAAAALLLVPLLSAACGRAEEPEVRVESDSVLDGLSPDQIREQAEPMSPERAAELGIVDTTIHLEQLTSPGDSALSIEPQGPLLRDTAS